MRGQRRWWIDFSSSIIGRLYCIDSKGDSKFIPKFGVLWSLSSVLMVPSYLKPFLALGRLNLLSLKDSRFYFSLSCGVGWLEQFRCINLIIEFKWVLNSWTKFEVIKRLLNAFKAAWLSLQINSFAIQSSRLLPLGSHI